MLELLGQKEGLFDLYARESEVGALALSESDQDTLKSEVLRIEKERLNRKKSKNPDHPIT